jgi:branched-chain amino acid transport system permease protein
VLNTLGLTIFGVDWQFFKPYIVLGFALGGVYALSGVGLVVLYRTTGVLNLAFGAVGGAGALIAWWMIQHTSAPDWAAYIVAIAFGGVLTLLYGLVFGPPFAARDSLVKMMGTLGLSLILLGIMAWRSPVDASTVRILTLESSAWRFSVAGTLVNGTQVIALGLALVLTTATTVFLRVTGLGTAMRALANDREISATLGVPVRRVEASAWLGSGLVCGAAGLLLADLLQTLDYSALTFLVTFALAAAVIGRLSSLWATMVGGIAIGLAQSLLNPYFSIAGYRRVAPFVVAIAVLIWLGRHRVVVISRTAR